MLCKLSIKESKEHHSFAAWNEERCGYKYPFLNEQSLESFLKHNIYTEETLINEITYEHASDIDYIYEQYLKPFVNNFLKNDKKYIKKFSDDGFILYTKFDSNELPSDVAKQANQTNPIEIGIGIMHDASFYIPQQNNIFFTILPSKLIQLMHDRDISFDELEDHVKRKFKLMLSESNLKATISHELAHWLDESLRDNKVSTYLKKIPKQWKQENISVNNLAAEIEVQAYMNGLNTFRKSFSDNEWNNLTFKELFELSTPLRDLLKLLKQRKDKNIIEKWKRKFFERMARENLIGKNMKSEQLTDLLKI